MHSSPPICKHKYLQLPSYSLPLYLLRLCDVLQKLLGGFVKEQPVALASKWWVWCSSLESVSVVKHKSRFSSIRRKLDGVVQIVNVVSVRVSHPNMYPMTSNIFAKLDAVTKESPKHIFGLIALQYRNFVSFSMAKALNNTTALMM